MFRKMANIVEVVFFDHTFRHFVKKIMITAHGIRIIILMLLKTKSSNQRINNLNLYQNQNLLQCFN